MPAIEPPKELRRLVGATPGLGSMICAATIGSATISLLARRAVISLQAFAMVDFIIQPPIYRYCGDSAIPVPDVLTHYEAPLAMFASAHSGPCNRAGDSGRMATIREAVCRALAAAGVECIAVNGGGAGVRLRKP